MSAGSSISGPQGARGVATTSLHLLPGQARSEYLSSTCAILCRRRGRAAMRKARLRASALLGALLAVFPLPAATSQEGGAFCTYTASFRISPGLSATPSTGRFTSNGRTGSADCQGQLRGRQVTGRGTFGLSGNYDGGCALYGISGRFSSRFPTSRGQLRHEGSFEGTGSGPQFGLVSASSRGEEFQGTFQFTPTRGDCVTTPITEGRVTVQGLWQ